MVKTNYENLFTVIWQYGADYIGWVMALVFCLVLGIMVYEWFRFKP